LEWFDPRRSRRVPAKLYYPETGPGPFALIIFSHGLGGSRENYAYLGRHWASAGYVAVHVQHLGSDEAVWRESQQPLQALQRAAANLQNALDRPRDISFAIDQMEHMHRQEGPLAGRLDLSRIGVAGHSFGAYTTLAVAGEVLVGRRGGTLSFVDLRVQAAIPMSTPANTRAPPDERSIGGLLSHCGRAPKQDMWLGVPTTYGQLNVLSPAQQRYETHIQGGLWRWQGRPLSRHWLTTGLTSQHLNKRTYLQHPSTSSLS